MKYMGSKARIAREILPIILKNKKDDQWYIEPFAGGCNIIDKVPGKRIANDINFYLMKMFSEIQNGWTPPENVDKKLYNIARESAKIGLPLPDAINAEIGFIGIGCSYSGKWFGGLAGIVKTKTGITRNYIKESIKNLKKQSESLQGVIFKSQDYRQLEIPRNSIIYCDPPYQGTTKYKDDFDHVLFWEWCNKMVKDGHKIFVSEYKAPDDWQCVWEKEVKSSLSANGKQGGSKNSIEKLFTKYEII